MPEFSASRAERIASTGVRHAGEPAIMRTHDIVCVADGWAYQLNGVEVAQYPSWDLAVNAARKAAERESLQGYSVALRYRGLDGTMKDIQTRPKRVAEAFGSRRILESANPAARPAGKPERLTSG